MFAIKPLMFGDAMIPNSFQVSFCFDLTIGIKKVSIVVRLYSSGVILEEVKKKGFEKGGDKIGNQNVVHPFCSDSRNESNGIFALGVGFFFFR